MTFVSVICIRLQSIFFLPFFILHSNRTNAQICKSEAFVARAVRREADLAFWTLTVWRSLQAMRGANRTLKSTGSGSVWPRIGARLATRRYLTKRDQLKERALRTTGEDRSSGLGSKNEKL
jgi:hypothetical protein